MIPHDIAAEREVIGCVIATRHGLAFALETGLGASDFYAPAHQRIYGIAPEVNAIDMSQVAGDSLAIPGNPDEWAGYVHAVIRTRIGAFARAAGVDAERVAELVRKRTAMWGPVDAIAAVIDTARRRRALESLEDAARALMAGAEIEGALSAVGAA